MKARLRDAKGLLKETLAEWRDDGAMQWGAALAYYAILSLPPLVLILLFLAGNIYGDATARLELLRWIERIFGDQGLAVTRMVLENRPEGAGFVGVGSGIFLVLVATGVFAQLQRAMNAIWGVEWPGASVTTLIRARALGFLVVLVLGAIFAAAVAASAAFGFVAPYAERLLPAAPTIFVVLNNAFTFVLVTILFASFFRVLPDVRISWRDVWVGAGVSALLFLAGNGLLTLYLRRSAVGSAYGAAGSLLGVLVWIYYSAQVYFFGAEFTQVWARRYGGALEPARGAVRKDRMKGSR